MITFPVVASKPGPSAGLAVSARRATGRSGRRPLRKALGCARTASGQLKFGCADCCHNAIVQWPPVSPRTPSSLGLAFGVSPLPGRAGLYARSSSFRFSRGPRFLGRPLNLIAASTSLATGEPVAGAFHHPQKGENHADHRLQQLSHHYPLRQTRALPGAALHRARLRRFGQGADHRRRQRPLPDPGAARPQLQGRRLQGPAHLQPGRRGRPRLARRRQRLGAPRQPQRHFHRHRDRQPRPRRRRVFTFPTTSARRSTHSSNWRRTSCSATRT